MSTILDWCKQIEMLTPKDYIGPLMELAQDRRGEFKEMKFITESRASITYELPLAEVTFCFVVSPLSVKTSQMSDH